MNNLRVDLMKNENNDVNDLINLNIQCHMLEKELKEIKNALNDEKKVNLMSKEYILVLESKINDLTDIKDENDELFAENKTLNENLKSISKKCYDLSEKLNTSNEQYEDLSKNNTSLEEKISHLSEQITEKENDLEKISEENKVLHTENEQLNSLNETYENSTSWKLTKPFRLLGNKFH